MNKKNQIEHKQRILSTGCIEFINNEKGYLHWLRMHPNGYVINTERRMSTNYMWLHRASCRLISEYTKGSKEGGFTERTYIKICSDDLESIRKWAKCHGLNYGIIKDKCSTCNP